MTRVVLDTNVVVAGGLRPASDPARVLSLIDELRIRPLVDARIMDKYREVLARPKFRIPSAVTTDLLRSFAELAEHVKVEAPAVARLAGVELRDPDDRPFMEVALSAAATAIVTGNPTHVPRQPLEPVRVLTPRQLLEELGIE